MVRKRNIKFVLLIAVEVCYLLVIGHCHAPINFFFFIGERYFSWTNIKILWCVKNCTFRTVYDHFAREYLSYLLLVRRKFHCRNDQTKAEQNDFLLLLVQFRSFVKKWEIKRNGKWNARSHIDSFVMSFHCFV